MTLFHDISPLNIFPSPVWELNEGYMAKLSRLVKRAQQTRRTTIRRGLNIRSGLSFSYAMANPLSTRIETTRFGERAIGQLALAGLEILRTGR